MQRIPDAEESEHEVLSPMSDGHGVHPEIRIIREHADAFAGGCQGLADHGGAYFKSGCVGEALSANSIIEHCADTKISGHGYERPLDEFLVTALTTAEQFLAWGWRLPFLISILFALVGLWIRAGVPESAQFTAVKEEHKDARAPLAEALRTSPKQILAVIGMRMVDQSTFYMGFTFSLAYVKNFTDTPTSTVLTASMVAMVLAIPFLALWGRLADKYGRKWFYIIGPLAAALAAAPFFAALESGELIPMILGFCALINLGHNISTCVQQTWFTDMFDVRIRYSGAGFAYALAGAVGGFIPLIATALMASSGSWAPAAALLAGLCLIALVSSLWSYKWANKEHR